MVSRQESQKLGLLALLPHEDTSRHRSLSGPCFWNQRAPRSTPLPSPEPVAAH